MERITNERGSILILSLWVVILLALFAIGLSHRSSLELKLTGYQWDEVKLFRLAKMGVVQTLQLIQSDLNSSVHSFNQGWSHSHLFQELMLPEGSVSLKHTIKNELMGDQTFFGLQDEESKININHAGLVVLENLFATEPDVVPSILDWIDKDNNRRKNGAESSDYNGFTCRNGPFESVEEILLVKGVTPHIFSMISPLITVYGEGFVNLNTASSHVLELLGLERTLVDKIIDFRRGEDLLEGTEDDGVFTSKKNIFVLLGERAPLSASEIGSFKKVSSFVGVRSDYFRMNLFAKLSDGSAQREFQIVVSPRLDHNRIWHWREVI